MTRRKWWIPIGLLISATFILAGVGLLFSIPPSQPEPPPGWQIIRPPHDVFALAEQRDTLWTGGQEGVFRLDRGSGALIEELEHDPPLEHVWALLVDQGGALWVGHHAGLSRYEDGIWQEYSQDNGLPDNRVNALMLDRDGRLWVGTWGGAAVRDGEGWEVITAADGLADDMVNVMLQDRQGGLWFGSYVAPRGGISHLSEGEWQYFTTENGLPHNNVTSLLETRDGRVWAGTGLFDRGGACQFTLKESEWTITRAYTRDDGLAGDKVRSLFQDHASMLWFGSEYDGLALLGQDAWITLNAADGLAHLEVKAILQDSDGNVWLGTRDGVTRISAGALTALYKRLSP